ncbi:endodeoxyribonuclease [Lithospermum erythrorhizon]|uniref:Endodeoxyribonuclease n=1 Tax=Lithospermum erythrorhizon TaxID=34254 RepID=A0AAV3NVG5_LITER
MKIHLPAYCLVNCDPYGFDILSIYRFGSLYINIPCPDSSKWHTDGKFMRVPEICWLGAFPSDAEEYCLPQQCLLHLTTVDKIRMEALLRRCYLQREAPDWRFELQLLLGRVSKVILLTLFTIDDQYDNFIIHLWLCNNLQVSPVDSSKSCLFELEPKKLIKNLVLLL